MKTSLAQGRREWRVQGRGKMSASGTWCKLSSSKSNLFLHRLGCQEKKERCRVRENRIIMLRIKVVF